MSEQQRTASQSAIAEFLKRQPRMIIGVTEIKRCASCGEKRNLTSGIAAGNEILYCRRCKSDEEQR